MMNHENSSFSVARIVAFYGFKGGAGRSLLLANTAAALEADGQRVLMVDADFEAPGLGDFFDHPKTPERVQWRATAGLMDMMREVARRSFAGELGSGDGFAEDLSDLLFGSNGFFRPQTRFGVAGDRRGAIRIAAGLSDATKNDAQDDDVAAPSGGLWLLGPGDHRADESSGVQRYVANFLSFDWNAFVEQGGEEILLGVRRTLIAEDSPYDVVLLDVRTGYNLSALLLVKCLADVVVGVSTESVQSLDGMARVLPVLGSREREVERFLVLSGCYSGEEESREGDVRYEGAHVARRRLVEAYFPEYMNGENLFELRFIDTLHHRRARLLWGDSEARRAFDGGVLSQRDDTNDPASQRRQFEEAKEYSSQGFYAWAEDIRSGAYRDYIENVCRFASRVSGRTGMLQKEGGGDAVRGLFRAWEESSTVAVEDEEALQAVISSVERFLSTEDEESARTYLDEGLKGFAGLPLLSQRFVARKRLAVATTGPSVSGSRLQDLIERFDLDIDPARSVVALREGAISRREADGERVAGPAPLEDDTTERMQRAIGVVCRAAREPETQLDALDDLIDSVSNVDFVAMLRRAARTLMAPESDPNLLDEMVGVMDELVDAMEAAGNPLVPITGAGCCTWNLLDLAVPIGRRYQRYVSLKDDRAPHRRGLEPVGRVMLDRLQEVSWVVPPEGVSDLGRQLRQWGNYLHWAAAFLPVNKRVGANIDDLLHWGGLGGAESGEVGRFVGLYSALLRLRLFFQVGGRREGMLRSEVSSVCCELLRDECLKGATISEPWGELVLTAASVAYDTNCVAVALALARRIAGATKLHALQLKYAHQYAILASIKLGLPVGANSEHVTVVAAEQSHWLAIAKMELGFYTEPHEELKGALASSSGGPRQEIKVVVALECWVAIGYAECGMLDMASSTTIVTDRVERAGFDLGWTSVFALRLAMVRTAICLNQLPEAQILLGQLGHADAEWVESRAWFSGLLKEALGCLLVTLMKGERSDGISELGLMKRLRSGLVESGVASADSAIAQWLGVQQQVDLGLLMDVGSSPRWLKKIVQMGALMAESAARRGRDDVAGAVLAGVNELLGLSEEGRGSLCPGVASELAICEALSWRLSGYTNEKARSEAVRLREIDIGSNGERRSYFYERVWEFTGLSGYLI